MPDSEKKQILFVPFILRFQQQTALHPAILQLHEPFIVCAIIVLKGVWMIASIW